MTRPNRAAIEPGRGLPRGLPLLVAFIVHGLVGGAGRAMADGADADNQGKGPWERVHLKDGILVQRRTVPGTNLAEFQGSGVIDAPISRVLAVIFDAKRRCEWMPSCHSARDLSENPEQRFQLSYHRTKAPWPVSDRESINRGQMLVEPAKHRVYLPFEAVDYPALPVPKGVIRMPFLRGHWILVPGDGGKTTQVEYRVHANPGGTLPVWLANLTSKALPNDTISGLRKQVTRASYPELEAKIQSSPEHQQLLDSMKN